MTQTAPSPIRERPPGVREAAPPAVRASWTANFVRLGVVSVAVALFLTFSGAFDLGFAPVWKRLAYWLALLLFGSAFSVAGQRWLLRREPAPWGRIAALALGLTALMTPVVFLATRWVFGGGWGWGEFASFLGPVLVVSSAMTALNVLTLRARRPPPAAHLAVAPGPGASSATVAVDARFRERLPLRLRGAAIHAVEAEDHYLRVHTDRGSDLLLMRLADALEELSGVEGARTHRSWWVARAAVADARRGDGRAVLVLRDGTEVPVSRSYAPALREAGWF